MIDIDFYKIFSLDDLPGEVWLDVVGKEGRLKVSNLGRIKSLSRKVKTWNGTKTLKEIIVKQRMRGEYLAVKNDSVHRIVCRAFNKSDDYSLHVNHINGIKTDNRSCNLEWCTPSKNSSHAWETGLCNESTRKKMSDKAKLRVGKLNSCWRGYVDIFDLDDKFIVQVETLKHASEWVRENTNFKKADKGNISLVCNGLCVSMYEHKFKYNKEEK